MKKIHFSVHFSFYTSRFCFSTIFTPFFLHMQNCPPYVDKVVDNFLFFLFSFPGLLVSILQFLLKIGLFHTISSLFSFIPSFPYYVDNFFFNLVFYPPFLPFIHFPVSKTNYFFLQILQALSKRFLDMSTKLSTLST